MLLKQHLIWLFLSVIMDSARGYGSYVYGNENSKYSKRVIYDELNLNEIYL